MARVTNGLLSGITWASNTGLVSSSAVAQEFAYSESGNPAPTTGLGATTETQHGTLKTATATLTSRYDSAEIGNAAGIAVASSGYYAEHIRQWSLTMAATVDDTTEFDTGTNPVWRSFAPGLVRISGLYEGRPSTTVDQTGASGAGDTTRAITLTLRDSNTFSGDAIVSESALQINPEDAFITMNFAGAGDWTKAGTAFIGAGTIGSPTASGVGFATGELVATYTTGQTITGDAFAESISITVDVGGILTVQTQVRFTGAVAHA